MLKDVWIGICDESWLLLLVGGSSTMKWGEHGHLRGKKWMELKNGGKEEKLTMSSCLYEQCAKT
jgi:hypothetical protein